MSALRIVPGERAGPSALGILLPPGARTVLIVRPRSLDWDLLLVRGVADPTFREIAQQDAPNVARSFLDALRGWNEGGPGQVAAVASSREGHLIWADIGEFCLVACERVVGRPYRPCVFQREAEARETAHAIAAVLRPTSAGEQEIYLNTKHFAR